VPNREKRPDGSYTINGTKDAKGLHALELFEKDGFLSWWNKDIKEFSRYLKGLIANAVVAKIALR
jgi:hypothetical protein